MAAATVTRASEAAKRYANALFELAQDGASLATIQKDFKAFAGMVKASKDLRTLLDSPAFSRDEKIAAIGAIATKAGFSALFGKFLGAMAANGRASDMLGAESAFDDLYARQRGVKRALVRTAKPMSEAESGRINALLARLVGGEVELSSEVDAALIGGIQLRIGSQLVDASLAAKLDRMNTAMKGA